LASDDPFEPISDCSLVHYAQICRELVREGNAALPAARSVIARHRLTSAQWEVIDRGWSARICDSEAVRVAFRELYARD
jgi:hypothetical protein